MRRTCKSSVQASGLETVSGKKWGFSNRGSLSTKGNDKIRIIRSFYSYVYIHTLFQTKL